MTVTDVELAVRASGLLQTFNEAGVLDVADVRVADRICALGKEPDERVALAVALLVRGLRSGSVCIELATIAATITRAQQKTRSILFFFGALARIATFPLGIDALNKAIGNRRPMSARRGEAAPAKRVRVKYPTMAFVSVLPNK